MSILFLLWCCVHEDQKVHKPVLDHQRHMCAIWNGKKRTCICPWISCLKLEYFFNHRLDLSHTKTTRRWRTAAKSLPNLTLLVYCSCFNLRWCRLHQKQKLLVWEQQKTNGFLFWGVKDLEKKTDNEFEEFWEDILWRWFDLIALYFLVVVLVLLNRWWYDSCILEAMSGSDVAKLADSWSTLTFHRGAAKAMFVCFLNIYIYICMYVCLWKAIWASWLSLIKSLSWSWVWIPLEE